MSHRMHPNDSDAKDAILFDVCEDCVRHAEHLGLSLDKETWGKMWDRMIAVEFNHERYRSRAEAQLGYSLYNMYVALDRYTSIDPKTLFAQWKL